MRNSRLHLGLTTFVVSGCRRVQTRGCVGCFWRERNRRLVGLVLMPRNKCSFDVRVPHECLRLASWTKVAVWNGVVLGIATKASDPFVRFLRAVDRIMRAVDRVTPPATIVQTMNKRGWSNA